MHLSVAFALSVVLAQTGDPIVLTDLQGKKHALEGRVGVLVFTGPQCPVANAYIPRLNKLPGEFPEAVVLAVNSNRTNSPEELLEHARTTGFALPLVKDRNNLLADRLGILTTPTAVVFDRAGNVAYRGRIDDSKMEDRVASHDLRRAIGEVLAGQAVTYPETEPFGCFVKRAKGPAPAGADADVTYAKHVAPILQRSCVPCHRSGQIGPFPLENYDDASAWAEDIQEVVRRRVMPPWKPVNDPSFFVDPRVLSKPEIDTLMKWVEAGAPIGDPGELPPPAQFRDGWMLGTPDMELSPEADFEIHATGPDLYRSFALPTNLPEDRWVTAVEIRPGNPRVVHHVVTMVDTTGAAARFDRQEPGAGYVSKGMAGGFIPASEMGGWTPGMTPRHLPKGVGRILPKGSTVVLDIHYHPSGRVEKDRTKIGLYFSKDPIRKRLRWIPAFNMGFRIPAGASRHVVKAQWMIPEDSHLLGAIPHMHYRGIEAKLEITRPDGTRQVLIDIKDWDFNWQELYFFSKPVPAPKGTKINLTCVFDNSAENPRNPVRPPVAVGWGGNTTDEMVLSWVCFTLDKEDRTRPKTEASGDK